MKRYIKFWLRETCLLWGIICAVSLATSRQVETPERCGFYLFCAALAAAVGWGWQAASDWWRAK